MLVYFTLHLNLFLAHGISTSVSVKFVNDLLAGGVLSIFELGGLTKTGPAGISAFCFRGLGEAKLNVSLEANH